jgi:hypothetical protein
MAIAAASEASSGGVLRKGGASPTGCATSCTLASEVTPDHAALQPELDAKVELLAESPKAAEVGRQALVSGQTSLAILIQQRGIRHCLEKSFFWSPVPPLLVDGEKSGNACDGASVTVLLCSSCSRMLSRRIATI